jgi:predicted ATPase/DNA-binding CsgD family transcriptional regulator
VLVSGEPGIGKTRLAHELCAEARDRNAAVAWGNCLEGAGAPLCWPWVLVLRDLVRLHGAATIRRQMGAGAPAIVSMVPGIGESIGPVAALRPLEDAASARFRFHDAMAGFLGRAAADSPLVVVLDDLQWADAPTLALLSFLPSGLAQSRVLVLGTYRDAGLARGSALERALGELAREGSCERIALPALARDEVSHYLAAVWGSPAAEGVVDRVLAGTEGNAFFVTEVARLLGEEGASQAEETSIPLPASVLEAIRRRLDGLTEACVRLLAAAAASGSEFAPDVVTRVLDAVSEHDLLESLAEAAQAGMVRRLPEATGRWEFTHALVRQALLEETPLADRPALHARIAASLEAEYGDGAAEHSREIAEHLSEAGAAADRVRLTGYLTKAGEQALAAYAYEDAREFFRRAIELRQGSSDDAVLADLWFGLGKAQNALSDSEATASLEKSREAFGRAGLEDRAIEVAACMPAGYHSVGRARDLELHRRMCARALAKVEPGTLRHAELLFKQAWLAGGTIRAAARREQMEAALAIARRHAEARLEARILEGLTELAVYDLDSDRIERYAGEALEVARRTDDLHGQCRALQAICNRDHLLYAPRPEVLRNADTLLLAARRLRSSEVLMWASWTRERLAWSAADWRLALALNAECRALLPPGACNPFLICNQAGLAYETDEIEEGDRALQEAIGFARREQAGSRVKACVAHYICRFMLSTARSANLEDARRLADEAASDPALCSEERDWVEQARALVAVQTDDRQAASEMYPVFAMRPRDPYRLRLSHIAGLLARTAGRMEDALRHLREGLAFCREGGSVAGMQWNLFFLAETLLQRSGAGDREEATALLDELDALAAKTGSVLVGNRARALRDGMASQPALPDGLTDREVEVLRLVARGYTNAEIGERLFISLHTVATHVHRILDKTGMANRTELASYAIRNKLAEA